MRKKSRNTWVIFKKLKGETMKTIDRYVIREMLLPICFGVTLFTFIFLIDILIQMMENIIVNHVSAVAVLQMLSYYLPPILAQTLPMGFFLGVMISYGGLTSTSELTAMISMGMSLKKIIRPSLIVAVTLTIFVFFLQEEIIPRSFIRLTQLTKKIAYSTPPIQLKEKTFVKDVGDYSVYIDKLGNEKNGVENLVLFKKNEKSPFPTVAISGKTKWEKSRMIMENTRFYQMDENGKTEISGSFESQIVPLASFLDKIEAKIDEVEALPVKDILRELRGKTGSERLAYRVELHKKLAVPLSTILLGVLGVLFSVGHHRTGKGVSFGVSIGVIFFYIAFINVGIVMSTKGKIPPALGIWFPNGVLLVLTYIMYLRKSRSS
jgi:lipopolysaccharide export system permease protein